MSSSRHKQILFLCTGNYYRSRYAEILFNSVARKMGLPWQASSSGLALERGFNNVGPIAKLTIQTLESAGIRSEADFTRFPIATTDAELERADRIIALKQTEHLPLLQERHPVWAEKVEFWHVEDDPHALPVIEREVMNLVAQLLGGGPQPGVEDVVHETAKEIAPAPKKILTAKVGRETAGRGGKGVTTVFDLPLEEAELKELAARLKQKCGTGGTVKNGRIEIQGDQRDKIVSVLESMGYRVKRAGG